MGNMLYNEICRQHDSVGLEIDFSGVEIMTPNFLREAIGKLFINDEGKSIISKPLKFSRLNKTSSQMLKLLIVNAIRQRETEDLKIQSKRINVYPDKEMSTLNKNFMYAG